MSRNIAAQAERGLIETLKKISNKTGMNTTNSEDMLSLSRHIKDISKAVHFAMPDGGSIFDDSLKGLRGVEIRLPYPLMTVSVNFSGPKPFSYLIVAKEVQNAEVANKSIPNVPYVGTSNIFVELACYVGTPKGAWHPTSDILYLPSKWDSNDILNITKQVLEKETIGVAIKYPYKELSTAISIMIGQPPNWLMQQSPILLKHCVIALLELLEALSCSNVSSEVIEHIDPVMNARRIRDGKLPMYEVRTLIVNAGKPRKEGDYLPGNGIEHREFLVRGHRRHYKSGLIIWVNSYKKGNPDLGRIDKDYDVRPWQPRL